MAKQDVPAKPISSFPTTAALGSSVLTAATLLLLGGGSPAARSLIVCIPGILFLVTGFMQRCDGKAVADGSSRATAALLGLPLLAAVQTAAFTIEPWSAAPVSAMLAEAVLLAAYLLFFLCACAAARSATQARALILALFAIGAGEALYGSLNFLSGNQFLLIFKRWAYLDSATGTLVNRNHFAYLLEMTIPIGFLVASTATAGSGPLSEQRVSHTEDGARRTLLGLPVAVMLLALLLSRSRMGLASLVSASIVVLLLDRLLRQPGEEARHFTGSRTGELVVVVSAALFLLLGVGVDLAVERFSRATSDLEVGRFPIWADTWKMVLAHPLLGSGFGSFEHLNASYRTGPTGFYVTHAHCDYLEVLAESGIVGLAIVASWIILFFRRLVRTLRLRLDPVRRTSVLATSVGILSVIIHSTVDFGLRVPAVTLTLLLVVAVFLGASADTPNGNAVRQRQAR